MEQGLPRAGIIAAELAPIPVAVLPLLSASPLAADLAFAAAVLVFAREEWPVSEC